MQAKPANVTHLTPKSARTFALGSCGFPLVLEKVVTLPANGAIVRLTLVVSAL